MKSKGIVNSPSRFNWPLLALGIGAFGIGTSEFAPMGLLPVIADGMNVSIPIAGSLVTAYAVGVMVGAPLITLALSRFGKRDALMMLMVIFIFGNLLSTVAPDYLTLMFGRIVTSLSQGAFFGFGAVVATQVVPKHKQASAVAAMFMGLSIANIGGVPAVTWLGLHIGWRMSFSGIMILGMIALISLKIVLPRNDDGHRPDVRRELRALLSAEMVIAMGTTVLFASAFFTLYTYVAPMLQQLTGASGSFVTLALALIGIGLTIGNWLGGKLADWSLDGATVIGMGTLSVSMLVTPLFLDSQIGVAIILPLWAISAFLVVPPLQMRAMRAAELSPSLAASINIAGFNLGNAVGASIGAGVISMGLGYAVVPLAGGGLALFGLCLVVLAQWRQQRPSL